MWADRCLVHSLKVNRMRSAATEVASYLFIVSVCVVRVGQCVVHFWGVDCMPSAGAGMVM